MCKQYVFIVLTKRCPMTACVYNNCYGYIAYKKSHAIKNCTICAPVRSCANWGGTLKFIARAQ